MQIDRINGFDAAGIDLRELIEFDAGHGAAKYSGQGNRIKLREMLRERASGGGPWASPRMTSSSFDHQAAQCGRWCRIITGRHAISPQITRVLASNRNDDVTRHAPIPSPPSTGGEGTRSLPSCEQAATACIRGCFHGSLSRTMPARHFLFNPPRPRFLIPARGSGDIHTHPPAPANWRR